MLTQSVERRTSVRIRTYVPIRLQLHEAPRIIETLTKDLSADGVRCITSDAIPVATPLRVEITLARGLQPVEVSGRTAWFGMIPHSDQFDLGIAFTEITPETKRRLSTYLERLAQ